jgi:hypothetical protein
MDSLSVVASQQKSRALTMSAFVLITNVPILDEILF